MGFLKNYRMRRAMLTAPESIDTLSAMERFFQNGKNWTQGTYHASDGSKCLVGAAQSVRTAALEDARFWLQQAIAERQGGISPVMGIEGFNDTHSFAEVAAVIKRAKQLALAAHWAQQPQAHPALSYQPEQDQVVTVTLADMERVAAKRDR